MLLARGLVIGLSLTSLLVSGNGTPHRKAPSLKGGESCSRAKRATAPVRNLASEMRQHQMEQDLLQRLLKEQTKELSCEAEILRAAKIPASGVRTSIENLMANGLENLHSLYLEIRELENHEATWDLPPEATTFGAVSYKDDPANPFKTREEIRAALALRQAAFEIALGLLPFGHHPEMNAHLKESLKNQKSLRGKTVDARPPFNKEEFLQNIRGTGSNAFTKILNNLEHSHSLEKSKLTNYIQNPRPETTAELKARLHKVGFFSHETWPHLAFKPEESEALKKMEAKLKSEERDKCMTTAASFASFAPKIGDVISFFSEACEAKENVCPVDVPTSFKKGMCDFLRTPTNPNHRPQFYGQARSLSGCLTTGGISFAAAIVPYSGKLKKALPRPHEVSSLLKMMDALAAEREAIRTGHQVHSGLLFLRGQHRLEDWVWADNKRKTVSRVVEETVGRTTAQKGILTRLSAVEEIDTRLALLNRPGRLRDLDSINRMPLDPQYTKGRDWIDQFKKELDPLDELLQSTGLSNPNVGPVLRGTEKALADVKRDLEAYQKALDNFGVVDRNGKIRVASAQLAQSYHSFVGAIGEAQFAFRAGEGFQYNTHLKEHTEKFFTEAQRLAAARDPKIQKRLEETVPVDQLKFLRSSYPDTAEGLRNYRINLVRNKELDAVRFAPDGTPTWVEIKNFSNPLTTGTEAHTKLVEQLSLLTVSADVWQHMGGKAPKLELLMLGGLSPGAVADLQQRFGSRIHLRY